METLATVTRPTSSAARRVLSRTRRLPASLNQAAGLLSKKKKSLQAHVVRLREEWSRSS